MHRTVAGFFVGISLLFSPVESPADTPGLNPAAPPETAQFGFLVGDWDCATKFMKPDGSTVILNDLILGPTSRFTIRVNDHVPNESVATMVETLNGIPIVTERVMYWDTQWENIIFPMVGGHCSAGVPND